MANADPTTEDLNDYDFDSRSNPYYPGQTWTMGMNPIDNMQNDPRRNVSPIQTSVAAMRQNILAEQSMMDEWRYQQLQQQHQQQHQHHNHNHNHQHMEFDPTQNALDMSYNAYHGMSMGPQMTMVPVTQAALTANLPMEYLQLQPGLELNWAAADFNIELVNHHTTDAGMAVSPYQQHTNSPTNSHLEVLSQPSTSEDGSWTMIDQRMSSEYERPYFVDPTHTLHDRRSLSESSYSDHDQSNQHGFMNLEMGSNQAVYSPTTLSDEDYEYTQTYHAHALSINAASTSSRTVASNALVRPITIPPASSSSKGSSPVRSPSSQGSAGSPGRKPTKKSPIAAKATDRVQKKTSLSTKNESTEKRVGRRKGPLKPEQRKQASEIRKLRACLRCKFLKKTCDKGEPCAGCQPSHARLWQVPCTRIDIKEIGYFLKDKRFDYERHVSLGFSVGNIKGFSDDERTLFITHGYGHMLPVTAREVYVRDEKCLKMDWIEANRDPNGYEVSTARLSAGEEGISTTLLSDYLDRHIDIGNTFEKFIDDYFEGTPFLSQMLKVAFKFYTRTKSSIIKKALKLMLAYNLTVHITMVEGITNEEGWIGKIEDEGSRFFGKTMAPVMINFQVKCTMADMWRELHKDVLEELSSLYSSVYSGDKLKNWPTIFILASVLLAVWECMQFDCHYRVPDEAAVDKFCSDMETTPVGVIVGLFSAISQKLPSVLEWDTSKHHALLGSNPDVCDTMTEVRQHVSQYGKSSIHHDDNSVDTNENPESYLRDRPGAKFDSKDFDSLSNKFLSRLVLRDIRAN